MTLQGNNKRRYMQKIDMHHASASLAKSLDTIRYHTGEELEQSLAVAADQKHSSPAQI